MPYDEYGRFYAYINPFSGGSEGKSPYNFIPETSVGVGSPLPLAYGDVKGNAYLLEKLAPSQITVPGGTITLGQHFVIAICEGEIYGLLGFWWEKEAYSNAWSTKKLLTFNGVDACSQALPAIFDPAGYQHTALVCSDETGGIGCPTGSATEAPNISFRIWGTTYASDDKDINPSDYLFDMLNHPRRGLGFASSILDTKVRSFASDSYRVYCNAAGWRFGLYLDSQCSALELLSNLMVATNSDAYWSQGKIKVVPKAAFRIYTPVHGTDQYIPPTTSAYDLGPDDLLGPIQMKRAPNSECFNSFPIAFTNRSGFFAREVVEDTEVADVDNTSVRRASVLDLPYTYESGSAPLSLSRVLAQRAAIIRTTYEFKVGWKYLHLEPTDLLTLTDAVSGLDRQPVRIVEIAEEGDEFTITAEDYPWDLQHPTPYAPPSWHGRMSAEKFTLQDMTLDRVADGTLSNKLLGVNSSHQATSTSLASGCVVGTALAQGAVAPYHTAQNERRTSLLGNATFGNWSRG